MAKLLPQEVCEEHEACRELEEACRALHRKWEGLSNRAEGIVESLTEKVAKKYIALTILVVRCTSDTRTLYLQVLVLHPARHYQYKRILTISTYAFEISMHYFRMF